MATISRVASATGGVKITPVALTAVDGVITPSGTQSTVFTHDATADVTLASPINVLNGVPVTVAVTAVGGARTLSFENGLATAVTLLDGQVWVGQLRQFTSSGPWILDDDNASVGSAVQSVNTKTGVVTLTADDIGDGTTNKAYTATEKTKLAGVATGATANATNAQLRDRTTHTGTQAVSTLATTGAKSGTTFLRGDDVWAVPAGGGGSGDATVFHAKAEYGAVGNGVTNDRAAIQAAIDAAFAAGGGTVYIPAGTYLLTTALTPKRRVRIVGDGISAEQSGTGTILYQDTSSAHCLSAVDLRDFTLEDITLVGTGAGTGNGINLTRSTNNDISGLTFRRIQVTGFGGSCINLSNPITSTFDRVLVDSSPVGFNVHGVTGAGGSAGTSVTFLNCYAAGCTQTGFRLDNMVYCAFIGCAADACGISYELIEAGTQGIAFVGCGCESMVSGGASYPGIGWKINAAIGVSLLGCFTYDSPDTSVWVTGSAQAVNVTAFSENSPQVGAPSSIKVDTGCTTTLDSISVTTAMSLAAGTTPLKLSAITSTTSATAGGASALPATPQGYITVSINGTNRKIPYYA